MREFRRVEKRSSADFATSETALLLVAGKGSELERPDFVPDFLLGAPELFLQPPEQFIILAFGKGEIVVGQVGILLLELAFDFVPGAFDFEFGHSENWIARPPKVDG